jgi:hypothetical protein
VVCFKIVIILFSMLFNDAVSFNTLFSGEMWSVFER